MKLKDKIFLILGLEDRLDQSLKAFARRHPNVLIIIADPKLDRITSAYKKQIIQGNIEGNEKVIKGILKKSRYQFKNSYAKFVNVLAQHLGLRGTPDKMLCFARELAGNLRQLMYFVLSYKRKGDK